MYHLRPNRPEIRAALGDGYLSNGYLALALVTYRDFLKRWPQHPLSADVREIVQKLEEHLPQAFAEIGLTFETDLEFACQHDEAQICLDSGAYSRAKALNEKLQRQKPDFIPPLNNLAQIYWLEGDLSRAIEMCQHVLAIQEDNVHALGNLIRFLYLAGRQAEAAPLLERLKASKARAFRRWTKIAEILAFIGDDAGMIALAQQAKKEADESELDALFYHVWAVSEAMLGQESAAKSHWKRALDLDPSFELARDNLDDLNKPRHERNGPWAFPFSQMLPRKVFQEMFQLAQRAEKRGRAADGGFRRSVQQFLDAHAEILQLVPLLLERGDAKARDFVIMLAEISGHPELLSLLQEYALGQKGSDRSRLRAAQALVKFGRLPRGQVNMWIEGEYRPILLLGFEITPEPVLDAYPSSPRQGS